MNLDFDCQFVSNQNTPFSHYRLTHFKRVSSYRMTFFAWYLIFMNILRKCKNLRYVICQDVRILSLLFDFSAQLYKRENLCARYPMQFKTFAITGPNWVKKGTLFKQNKEERSKKRCNVIWLNTRHSITTRVKG